MQRQCFVQGQGQGQGTKRRANESGHHALTAVVLLNESVKQISWQSHEVGLRALDAVVRSVRAGQALRGFVQVASHMRQWSSELQRAVEQISTLSAAYVETVSAQLRHERTRALLASAADDPASDATLRTAQAHATARGAALDEKLRRLDRDARGALEDLQQLGLMASVLSRAALIEAASGASNERAQLSEVARDFAKSSEQVIDIVNSLLKRHGKDHA